MFRCTALTLTPRGLTAVMAQCMNVGRSKGELLLQRDVGCGVVEALERLFSGQYLSVLRTRLRVSVQRDAERVVLDHRAVNEVFIAESKTFLFVRRRTHVLPCKSHTGNCYLREVLFGTRH